MLLFLLPFVCLHETQSESSRRWLFVAVQSLLSHHTTFKISIMDEHWWKLGRIKTPFFFLPFKIWYRFPSPTKLSNKLINFRWTKIKFPQKLRLIYVPWYVIIIVYHWNISNVFAPIRAAQTKNIFEFILLHIYLEIVTAKCPNGKCIHTHTHSIADLCCYLKLYPISWDPMPETVCNSKWNMNIWFYSIRIQNQ